MASNNMHNLTTLIKRLEAATSRLEDMAIATIEPQKSNGAPPTPAPTGPLPAPPVSGTPAAPKAILEVLPESIDAFDSFVAGAVKTYVNLSDEIGGAVAKQASVVYRAFAGQRKFLLITTKAKKPPMDQNFMQLIKPMQEAIMLVNDIRDKNRGSEYFNQLSAVSESMELLSWITEDTKPHKRVEDSLGSAQYWGNRVLKEYKEKDAKQVEWVQAYYKIFGDLVDYIKEHAAQGIPWNPKGLPALEALKEVEQAEQKSGPPQSNASTGAPPPPPPPPPGPPPPPIRFDDAPKAAPAADTSGLGAVFNDLNKGADVTKGLKKVTADQMTHKNPSLRAGATVPTRSESTSSVSSISRGKSPAPGKKPKPESMRTKKPPVKRLDGNKWIIENYDNESEPVRIDASIAHSILISRCTKTTVIVQGKFTAVSIDNSPKLSLVVDSLVSSVDVVKSSSFALQVMGTLPTILMDQVDGATIYLSKDSMNTEVFSSKCSSVNLNIIQEGDEDYKEVPLPEQIRTYITEEGKIVSEIVEHAG